jgi:hypothetical protein
MTRKIWISVAISLCVISATTAAARDGDKNADDAALRRKCAHALKVKLGIKETGSVRDLATVSGAAQQVDQCVASGGKLN